MALKPTTEAVQATKALLAKYVKDGDRRQLDKARRLLKSVKLTKLR
jgi:hypothetical protein